MNTSREHNLTLVEARVIKNGKVQLEFTQHCPNPMKKGRSSSASSLALQAMNAGDAKFEQSAGGTEIYHYYINGNREAVAKTWSIDLSALATTEGARLPLNIVNPKLLPATEGAQPLDVCLKLTELKATEMQTFYSEKALAKIRADFNAGYKSFKRKGKDGAFIKSNGENIYVDIDLALGTHAQHRFLPMDEEVQVFTAPVQQTVAQTAPVQQQAPVQTAPVQQVDTAGDLPF